MKIVIISVGRKSGPEITSLCQEYEKRLANKHQIIWQFVEPETGKMTRNEQRQRESTRIIDKIPDDYLVVLMDEAGKQINNIALGKEFDKWRQLPQPIVIVIGGAFGVSKNLQQRADFVWSLSKLVFPHEIVRLVLTEQIYRIQTILDNQPYHHE